MFKHFQVWQVILIFFTLGAAASAEVIHVDKAGSTDYQEIQAAIDAANDGDEVLVAPGEYIITAPITFQGKAIALRSEAGADETTIRMGTPTDSKRASVLVFENNETPDSILEGFTITGGRGCYYTDSRPGYGGMRGGGILCKTTSPTIGDCTITGNSANNGGGINVGVGSNPILSNCTISYSTVTGSCGGIACWDSSSITMTNCVIKGNSAPGMTKNVNGNGGGILCRTGSKLTMTYCAILENSAGVAGGGLFCWEGSILNMTYCIIADNTCQGADGGIAAHASSVTLANCTITRNWANEYAGAVKADAASSLDIRNCTICENGAGQYAGGVYLTGNSLGTMTNSIIRNNTAPSGSEIYLNGSSIAEVRYSNVAESASGIFVGGGCTLNWGAGNIDADPSFAEPGHWADVNDLGIVVEPNDPNAIWIDSDFHLKSEAGRWDPNDQSWVIDEITSPCIDRGDPDSPVGDEPDPNGGLINMGAYGGTAEASMSIGHLAPLPPPGPLAHWKLDETQGFVAYDSSGHALDGTLMGGPLWQPESGMLDGALECDGMDDCVHIPFVLDPSKGAFSVFAWIKDGAPGQVIIAQANGADWLLTDTQGCIMTFLISEGRRPGQPLSSQAVVTDGNWHHIGLVWDLSYRSLYVDNELVAIDVGFQNNFPLSQEGLYLGTGSNLQSGTFWSGLIDDMRIYDRVAKP